MGVWKALAKGPLDGKGLWESGQRQPALTEGVLSCVRADMFTACSVFYDPPPPPPLLGLSSSSDVMEQTEGA